MKKTNQKLLKNVIGSIITISFFCVPLFSVAQDVNDIVTKSLAFKAMLTSPQQAELEQTYSDNLAENWSNLPCGGGCRNGIDFGSLSASQLDAALDIIIATAGTATTEGYTEFMQILTADSLLSTLPNQGGGGFGKENYFISFLNTPTTTGSWMLQYGGHHFAANIAFNNGLVVGVTPYFSGIEPKSWTNGLTISALDNERNALADMLAALSTSELSTAYLSTTFTDILLGPGQDGVFPGTKLGIPASSLTSGQQAIILQAMQPYLNDMGTDAAATMNTLYQNELAGTYISYSGSTGTTGNANTFLSSHADYVRIDGPSVWIEFVCQTGVMYPNEIHYHSIWRDHTRDYGNYLANNYLSTSIASFDKANGLKTYPNPSSYQINLSLPSKLNNAIVKIIDAKGKIVVVKKGFKGNKVNLNISNYPKGNYIIKVEDSQHTYSSKFTKI